MSTKLKQEGNVAELTIKWDSHRPHWQAYGTGSAWLELTRHDCNYLSIDATESGDKSSRRIMLTLSREAAKALAEFVAPFLVEPATEPTPTALRNAPRTP